VRIMDYRCECGFCWTSTVPVVCEECPVCHEEVWGEDALGTGGDLSGADASDSGHLDADT